MLTLFISGHSPISMVQPTDFNQVVLWSRSIFNVIWCRLVKMRSLKTRFRLDGPIRCLLIFANKCFSYGFVVLTCLFYWFLLFYTGRCWIAIHWWSYDSSRNFYVVWCGWMVIVVVLFWWLLFCSIVVVVVVFAIAIYTNFWPAHTSGLPL